MNCTLRHNCDPRSLDPVYYEEFLFTRSVSTLCTKCIPITAFPMGQEESDVELLPLILSGAMSERQPQCGRNLSNHGQGALLVKELENSWPIAKDGGTPEAIIVMNWPLPLPWEGERPESFAMAEKLILLSILLANPTSGKREAMNGDGGIVWI